MCSNLCFILTKQEYRFQVYQEKKQFVGEWPPLPSRLQAELAGSGRSSGGFLAAPRPPPAAVGWSGRYCQLIQHNKN